MSCILGARESNPNPPLPDPDSFRIVLPTKHTLSMV